MTRKGNEEDAKGASPGIRFEDALERLETLVRELEAGDLPLEETIVRFEEGQRLLKTCGDLLDRAELRVREILKRDDGTLSLGPFTPGEGNDAAS